MLFCPLSGQSILAMPSFHLQQQSVICACCLREPEVDKFRAPHLFSANMHTSTDESASRQTFQEQSAQRHTRGEDDQTKVPRYHIKHEDSENMHMHKSYGSHLPAGPIAPVSPFDPCAPAAPIGPSGPAQEERQKFVCSCDPLSVVLVYPHICSSAEFPSPSGIAGPMPQKFKIFHAPL